MKAVVNPDGTFSVEVEAEQTKDLFEEISRAQEVFGNLVCRGKHDGKIVESSKVVLRVRQDDEDNKYYEAVCMEDGPLKWAKKEFGVNKKGGGLFPRTVWMKYDKDKGASFDVLTGEKIEK